MANTCDLANVQGNILRGYRMSFVRHIVVRVDNVTAARSFLLATSTGSAGTVQIRNAVDWGDSPPQSCLNVGVTATGLRALGVPDKHVESFPSEFLDGAPNRRIKVGDLGESDPENWCDGLGEPDNAHLMWSIHAVSASECEATADQLLASWSESHAFTVTSIFDGAALPDDPNEAQLSGQSPADAGRLHGDKVHFGYRDSIAQPRFLVNGERLGRVDKQPIVPLGGVLLGYEETPFPDVSWHAPSPHELSSDGTFNAFRVLEQDVVAFEEFLERCEERFTSGLADGEAPPTDQELAEQVDVALDEGRLGWGKEFVAAKLMGRWRNGVPLVMDNHEEHRWPDSPLPLVQNEDALNAFDYPDAQKGVNDFEGVPCPLGAHIRRSNPRSGWLVQSGDNHTRPIVRRGMPYGPAFDPDEPAHREDTTTKRGLLGNFFCASLVAQFEAIMYDWVNLGLQHPDLTRTNDPIIGANDPSSSRFDIPIDDARKVTLKGFPRFTTTVAGIYLFFPSLTGIRYLATEH